MAFRFPDDVCLAYVREKIYNGAMDEKIRINKYLSEAGFCSRREADSLIQEGRVTVDGRRAEPGEKSTSDTVVYVDGKAVKKVEEKVLLLFYKPRGVVCSTKKQRQETTVTEYLNYPLRVYPIGRLDKDSEGLLLLTNQGDLVNKIMRSTNAHEKEYIVTVDKVLTDEFIKQMSEGVWLEELERKTLPCKVRKQGERRFSIILTQGLNRQIRRMCQACGYRVHLLRRVRIMNIQLGGLKTGEYRKVTGEEYKRLIKLLEGSTSLSEADRRGKRYVAFHPRKEDQVNKWKQRSRE